MQTTFIKFFDLVITITNQNVSNSRSDNVPPILNKDTLEKIEDKKDEFRPMTKYDPGLLTDYFLFEN